MRHSSGRQCCARMVITFRVYLGRIRAPDAPRRRFDQRKAVTPFRMDKWQSPARTSPTDFACSRCGLTRGSHARHPVRSPSLLPSPSFLHPPPLSLQPAAVIPLSDTTIPTELCSLCVSRSRPRDLPLALFRIGSELKGQLSLIAFDIR